MGKRAQLKRIKKGESLSGRDLSSNEIFEIKFDGRVERAILFVLFIIILYIGLELRLSHLDIPRRSPDEGIYTYQARKIAEYGTEGTRRLIDEHNKDKSLWIYPPPTRIGHNYLVAAFMKISGTYSEMAGTYISIFTSVGTLFVLLVMGLRFFNPWATLIALLGISVSPMDLAIARRCWQDSLLAFVGTLYIYIIGELAGNPKRKILYLPLFVIGSYCILIKESGIVIFGLGILWLFLKAVFKERSLSRASIVVVIAILTLATSLFALVKSAGGISTILEVLRNWKEAMPTNAYALEYQTGPWFRLVEGLWILTPFFTISAFLGSICVFLGGRLKDAPPATGIESGAAVRWIVFFTAAFITIMIITPYSQNIRYVSVAFAPFYLLAGFGVWSAVLFLRAKLGNFYFVTALVIIITVVAIIAIRDYQLFKRIFIERGVVDLSIRLLREYS